MSYLRFCTKLAAGLGKIHGLGQDKQTELAYAIEVLFLNILNTILVLTLGWVMGVFWGTLTCLLTMAAFRYNAGGGHSESPWKCAMVTMIVFPSLALASRYLNNWPVVYQDLLSLASVLVGLSFIHKFAPVENPKSPIVSPRRRKRLKNTALIIMCIAATIIAGLKSSHWGIASEIRFSLVLCILWFSFNLTSAGKRFWSFVDSIGTNFERRC